MLDERKYFNSEEDDSQFKLQEKVIEVGQRNLI